MDLESKIECNVCYRDDIKLNNCKNERCTFIMCDDCFDIYTNDYKYKKCPQCKINIEKLNFNKLMRRHLDKHIIKYLTIFSVISYFVGYSITNNFLPFTFVLLNFILGCGVLGFSLICLILLYSICNYWHFSAF